MTRLADLHGAVNLGQGFPDFPAPDEVKEAARRAIADDHNQYPVTWGVPEFREAIAAQYERLYGMRVDPEREICVTCGSTEAMIAAMLGLVDPGDEIVVFEPFYENYGPDAVIAGAVPRLVTLHPPDWTFDEAELRAAFSDRTRAIVVNSPNNPTGKVFSREELSLIAELCVTHDVDRHHRRDLRAPDLRRRGARADRDHPRHGGSHRHDQRAVEDVLGHRLAGGLGDRVAAVDGRDPHGARLPDRGRARAAPGGRHHRARPPRQLLRTVVAEYDERRALLISILAETGFQASPPKGAYYVMADISHLDYPDDVAAAHDLVERIGVGTVPGSSFFSEPKLGAHLLRFTFCKKLETLEAAGERLRTLV